MKKQIIQLWRKIWRANYDRDDSIAAVAHVLMQLNNIEPYRGPLFRKMLGVPDLIADAVKAAVKPDEPGQAATFLRLFIEAELAGKSESGQFASSLALRDILASLAEILPIHDLIDPACGTGQLLTSRHSAQGVTVGIERTHLWAYVAEANCRLNGIVRNRIFTADALSASLHKRFDRGICNPPFGKEAPPVGWEWSAGSDFIRREAPFIEFMRAHLESTNDACAAMLVSDDFLSEKDPGSTLYRRTLVTSDFVRACVTLPTSAIGARTSLPSSALLLGHRQADLIWLIDASNCSPTQIPAKLIRWKEALRSTGNGFHRCSGDRQITRVFRIEGKSSILFEEQDKTGDTRLFRLARNSRAVPERHRDGLDGLTMVLDLRDQGHWGARALHGSASFIGLGFTPSELKEGDCRLVLRANAVHTPRTYAPERNPEAVLKALIDESQTFIRELESLAEFLQSSPAIDETNDVMPGLDPGDALSALQRRIWERIQVVGQQENKGRPFTAHDLNSSFSSEDAAKAPHLHDLRQTLAILECMGILVRTEETEQQASYRLLTIRDGGGGR